MLAGNVRDIVAADATSGLSSFLQPLEAGDAAQLDADGAHVIVQTFGIPDNIVVMVLSKQEDNNFLFAQVNVVLLQKDTLTLQSSENLILWRCSR